MNQWASRRGTQHISPKAFLHKTSHKLQQKEEFEWDPEVRGGELMDICWVYSKEINGPAGDWLMEHTAGAMDSQRSLFFF